MTTSTHEQRAMWAFETEYNAEKARRQEVQNLYAYVAELEASVSKWRNLAERLVANGGRLPKEVSS